MTFFSTLFLGLLASVHCAGMCGGLQTAFQHTTLLRSPQQIQRHLIMLNLGRIVVYTIIGSILAGAGASLAMQLNMNLWLSAAQFMRIATATILLLVGIQLIMTQKRPLLWLESLGYRLWRFLQDYLNLKPATNYRQSLRLGLIWGLLPCGLVYSVLLAASVSGSALNGSLLMLGFGIGTLPAMLLTGNAFIFFKTCLQRKAIQHTGGSIFIISGSLILLAPFIVTHDAVKNQPILLNLVNCFT